MNVSRRGFLAGSVGGLAISTASPAEAGAAFLQTVDTTSPVGELHYLNLSSAAARIRARKLSPVELMQAVLARIDRVEPKVHAFITLTREHALEAARTAEQTIAAHSPTAPSMA